MSVSIPAHLQDYVVDMMNSYLDDGLAGGLPYTMERIIDIAIHKQVPLRIIDVEGRWMFCMQGLAQVIGGLTSTQAQHWMDTFMRRSKCHPKTVFIDGAKITPPYIPLVDFFECALHVLPDLSGYVKTLRTKFEYYRHLVTTGSSEACRLAKFHTQDRIRRSLEDPPLGSTLLIEAKQAQTPFEIICAGFAAEKLPYLKTYRYPRYLINKHTEDTMFLKTFVDKDK